MTVVFTSRFAPIAPSLAGPPIPTGLAAAPSTQTQINLTWNPVTSDPGGPGLKDYGLYRIGTGLINYVTSVSYSDTGLTPGTAYTYYVTARDLNLVESPQSLPATATTYIAPPAPTGLTAHVNSTTQIEIDWNITTDPGGPGIVRYGVYLNGVSQGQVGSVSFLFNGLSPGTTYSFQVSSVDANNIESPLCAPVFATTQGSAGPSITIYNGFSFTVVPPGGALTSFGTRTATPLIWDHGQDAAGIMNASWGGGWPNAASNSVANLQNRTAPFQLLGSSTIQAPTPYTPRFLGGNHYDVNTSAGGNNVMAWAPMYPPPGASWYSYMEGYGMDDPNWWYCVGLTTYTFTATYVMGNSTFTYQGTIPAGITTGDGNQLFSLSNVAFTSTSASPCNIVSVDYVHNTITMNKTALVSATLGLQSVSYSDRDENVKKFDSTANSTVPYSALDWYATNTPGGPKTNTAGDSYTLGEFDGVPANPDNNGHSSSWNASNNPANPAKGYNGGWFKWSYAAKWSTGTDGFWKYWEVAPNGVSQIVVNYQGPTLYSGLTSWGESVGGYSRNQGAMGLNPFLTSPVQGAGVMGTYTQWRYFGNVYYDRNVSTLARFYLTNSPTYAVGSANLAEAQPPTAWAPTSATLTGNVGNLALGPAYLWFIDEANSISPTLVDTVTITAGPAFPNIGAVLIAGSVQTSFGTPAFQAKVAACNVAVIGLYPGWTGGGFNYNSAPAAVKAINPNIKLFPYTNIMEFQPGVGASGSPYSPLWVTVNANNWFLRTAWPAGAITDADGNAQSGINQTTFTTVVAGKNYLAFRAGWTATNEYASNWDGIYMDNVFWQPRTAADYNQSGSSQTAAASGQNWRNGYASYVPQLKTALPSTGQLIVGNVADWANPGAVITGMSGLLAGGIMESLLGASSSVENFAGWLAMMNGYKVIMLATTNPSLGIFMQDGVITDYQSMRYGLCSCLLDNAAYAHTNNGTYDTPITFDEYAFSLGSATAGPNNASNGTYSSGGITSWQNGVWRRDFQNGISLVNPKGNGAQTVTLETTYWHLRGTQANPPNNAAATTSVTLQDRDGLILSRTPT